MAVSVIISNFNGARFLPRLIESLQGQEQVELEIIVVDRHSVDESREILDRYPDVKVVSEPPLRGLVSGYHRGVREATHEHLFFCNEDMWFDPRCLALLEARINLPRRVGAADPWQWTYDEKNWLHGGVRLSPARWAVNCVYPFRNLHFMEDLPAGTEIPFPCAGAFLIHRQVYEEIGGWDTSIFLDNEDIDLFLRAWQRDWKCLTVPEAKVYHAVGMSNVDGAGKPRAGAGRRRYVSSRTSQAVIIAKSFSFSHSWLALASILVVMANNLVKLRFSMWSWDCDVLNGFFRRLPGLHLYRNQHRTINQSRPGECFFTDPRYQR